MLDDPWEAVLEVEGLVSLHSRVYEASHNQFKVFYRSSSRRRRTAIDKIIFTQNADNSDHFEKFIENRAFSVTINGCVDKALKRSSSFLTHNGA